MSLGEFVFIGWNLIMILTIIVYIYWAKQNGMFKKIEKPKIDMLDDADSLP